MPALFHHLRELRAGKPRMQTLARETSWSHSNHQGYLTACEAHQAKNLEKITGSVLTLLKKIAVAWEGRDRNSLIRLTHECEMFFDPQQPTSLVYFVGLGGIDLFVRLLCDNADWLANNQAGFSPFQSRNDDHGLHVYNTILRVLTELLVCHNDMGWYIHDRHRALPFRLLSFISVDKLRDSAIMLLEHLVTVVGPVFHIPSTPAVMQLVRSISDAGLASLTRVLALAVVPGVMTEQLWRSKRLEPYPQCLSRIRKIQDVVDDNVRWLIDEKEPSVVERLLQLAEVRSSGVRIFQGNRTVTVMVPPEPEPVPAGPQHPSVEAIMLQLQSWLQQEQGGPMTGGNAPPPALQMPPTLQMSIDEDSDDFEDVDSDGDDFDDVFDPTGGQATQPLQLSQEMTSNPAALHQALQLLISGSGTQPAAVAVPQQQPTHQGGAPQQPAAAPDATGNPQQALQQFAQTLSEEMLPVNSLDSINFSWFCGRPDTKGRWRLDNMRIGQYEDSRVDGTFRTQTEIQAKDKEFIKRLVDKAAEKRRNASSKQKQNLEAAEHQSIVNSQSEVFFVLNSIMVTSHYTSAWRALTFANVMPRCNAVFDTVFFLQENSTSIHASPPNRGRSVGSSAPVSDRYETPEEVAARASGTFYETYWNHPSKMSYVSTSAPSNPDELDDDMETTSSSSDFADDPEHRHDPDTLRKLELLRILHEYLNAQDRSECLQLMRLDSVMSCKDDICTKIAQQIAKGCEDACTDTIGAHCLEAYTRCFSFFVDDRASPSAPQNICSAPLFHHIIEERIYNATKRGGAPQSLLPAKRIDAFFALLGEMIKYNQKGLLLLQSYIDGEIVLKTEPTSFGAGNNTALQPARPQQQAPQQQAPQFSLARGDGESFLSVLQYRMRRFGVDTNLFTRCLVLSLTPHLTSPFNYVWKPLTATQDDFVTEADGRLVARSLREALEYLPTDRRCTEASSLQMDRIYYVRRNSRTMCQRLSEASPSTRYTVLRESLELLTQAPHTFRLEDRPIPQLFSTEEWELLRDGCPLPRAGLAPSVVSALLEQHNPVTIVDGVAVPTPFNARDVHFDQLRRLESALLSDPAALVYQMLSGMNAEAIENTERLCVVTSSILVFLRCSAIGGQAAVDRALEDLSTLASARLAQCAPSDRCLCRQSKHSATKCSINEPVDEQCDNFAVFGDCQPHSVVDDYVSECGTHFFKNFFRLMCIWFAHYSCSQRYVETLYYCSNVPFGEWKVISLYLWRRIPDFFTA